MAIGNFVIVNLANSSNGTTIYQPTGATVYMVLSYAVNGDGSNACPLEIYSTGSTLTIASVSSLTPTVVTNSKLIINNTNYLVGGTAHNNNIYVALVQIA